MSSFEDIAGSAHISPLDEQSFEMHELFLSLMQAGFSDSQALRLVAHILTETQGVYYTINEDMMEDEDDEDEDDEED